MNKQQRKLTVIIRHFDKINKIDESLANLMKGKKEDTNYQE